MIENNSPSVGIGLPVYNNSKHLSNTLDSILKQTYQNIIIYISDDCSHDGTETICRAYAAGDRRIQYSRNEKNMGPADNHRKVLDAAKTDFFMFARGHEVLSSNHIKECLKLFEEDHDVVLAYATTRWIDENDNLIPDKHFGYCDTRGCDVLSRCAHALWSNQEYFYGLTRTRIMRKVRYLEEIIGHDTLMIFEMALLGHFAHVPTSTRYRRYNYDNEPFRKRIRRYQRISFRRLRISDKIFPYSSLVFCLIGAVIRSKISPFNKLRIILLIFTTGPLRYIVAAKRQI